jgi:hypothetical protein
MTNQNFKHDFQTRSTKITNSKNLSVIAFEF